MKKDTKWLCVEGDLVKGKELAQSLHISPKLGSLLIQRNINSYEEAFRFFRPKLENLHDPFLMKGMDRAVNRVLQAIDQKESILLFGDYDVDGTSAVSLLYRFLKSCHPQVSYYLPDRELEGYGVSALGIERASKNGVHLIISLDCGIKSKKEVEMARALGIDFIIMDHHLPDENIPKADAILNPKQIDCPYPFKYLSGCGIAFKFSQALKLSRPNTGMEPEHLLDLVALSIACDMVEVEDENRILAYFGLKKLNSNPQMGIQQLLKTCQNSILIATQVKEPTENAKVIGFQEILFQLGPRINAAGRMGGAERVVELFTTEDPSLAAFISLDLNEENLKRREMEKSITRDALEMIQVENLENKFTNVLYHPEWHKGLVGIVASRVIEKHYAPTIILTQSQGKVSGSARSVGDFNIYEAIKSCGHLLNQFGGHAAAAGLSLAPENLRAFQTEFEAVVSRSLEGKALQPQILYHEELVLEEINPSFYKILDQFSPFGPGNPFPTFLSRGVRFLNPRILKETHLKVHIQGKKDILEGIGFGLGAWLNKIEPGKEFDICYQIEMNTFRGNSSLQLLIKDIKFSKPLWQN